MQTRLYGVQRKFWSWLTDGMRGSSAVTQTRTASTSGCQCRRTDSSWMLVPPTWRHQWSQQVLPMTAILQFWHQSCNVLTFCPISQVAKTLRKHVPVHYATAQCNTPRSFYPSWTITLQAIEPNSPSDIDLIKLSFLQRSNNGYKIYPDIILDCYAGIHVHQYQAV